MKHDTTFFVESVVPDLVEHVCQESRRAEALGLENSADWKNDGGMWCRIRHPFCHREQELRQVQVFALVGH
jgi:hypothetical protein